MCYSAQASFLTAGTLTPIGIYCLNSAFRRHREYWPVATIPIAFAIQQAMEGVIWTSLNHHNTQQAEWAARFYLFFALAWWPFWGPLTAFVAAQTRQTRRLFGVWTLLSTSWFFGAYLPAMFDSQSNLQVSVVHHCIRYSYSDAVLLSDEKRVVMTILYVFFTGGPLLFMKGKGSFVPLSCSILSIMIANYFYSYAYTSVWCIFAAILSSYCLIYFRWLDHQSFSANLNYDNNYDNCLSPN